MKRLILQIAVAMLRLIYLPLKGRRIRDKVTIISRQSDHPSVDIKLLSDYLKLKYPQIECTVLCRFLGNGLTAKAGYLFHMLRQMTSIASSRVVLLDGYCIAASVLHHKPETKIIQMWHAVAAIKKFGYQTIDQPGGHSRMVAETLHMHENYDHILCPGEETGRIFCEGFHATADKLVYLGLPRLDLIWDSGDSSEAVRGRFGISPKKEILLYVPTFRKGRPVYLKELVRSIDPEKFVLVVRLHPLDQLQDLPAVENRGLQVIMDQSMSTQEWLRACDRVITDYSALGVEASLTGKPLYYYIYDISEYERSTGLNVDPRKEMPHATAISGLQLADLLAGPYDFDELHRFRDKYITVDTDACTARLGDYIYGVIKEVSQEVSDASSEDEGARP